METTWRNYRIEEISGDLARFFVKRYTDQAEPVGEMQAVLCRLSADLYNKHGERMTQFVRENGWINQELTSVLRRVLNDECINWGRLVALFTYVGIVARQKVAENGEMTTEQREAMLDQIIDELKTFLVRNCGDWIEENGGWESLGEFQPQQPSSLQSWMQQSLPAGLKWGFQALYSLITPDVLST